MVVRSVVFGPVLSLLGSLASMTLVGEMWYAAFRKAVWCEVISLCHVNVFISHSGARCLRSLLEYSRSLELCLTSLSYSLVPGVRQTRLSLSLSFSLYLFLSLSLSLSLSVSLSLSLPPLIQLQ